MPSARPAQEWPVGGLGSGTSVLERECGTCPLWPWVPLVARLPVPPRLAALIAAVRDTLHVQPCKQCDAPTAIPAH